MNKITKQQQKEINFLNNLSDKEIDISEIPEVKDWSNAEVSKFYRPKKNK